MGIECGNTRSGCSVVSIDFKKDEALEAINGLSSALWSTMVIAAPKSSSRIQGTIAMGFDVRYQDTAERVLTAAQPIQPLTAQKSLTIEEIPAQPLKAPVLKPAVKEILKQKPAETIGRFKFSVEGFENNELAAAKIRSELQQFRKVAVTPEGIVRSFDQKHLEDLEIHYYEIKGRAGFMIHLPEEAKKAPHPMEQKPAIDPKFYTRPNVKQQHQLLLGGNEVVFSESDKKFVFTVGNDQHVKFA